MALTALPQPRTSRLDIYDRALGFITAFPPGENTVAAGSSTVVPSGTLILIGGALRAGEVVSKIAWHITTAAAGLTLAKVGLYKPTAATTATLLASSADNSAAFTAANSIVATSLSTPYAVTSEGFYYIGLVVVGTTGPTVVRSNGTFNPAAYLTNPIPAAKVTGLSDIPASASLSTPGVGHIGWVA